MRVLHLANGSLFGGIETFLVTLARLERSNPLLENHFLLSHHGRLASELQSTGAEMLVVDGVRIRHPWSVLRARRQCRTRVRELKPDVILAHGPWTYVVFGEGISAPAPVVFFQHGAAEHDLLHKLAGRCPPALVIANSPYTASTTSKAFPSAKVRICRYPLDPPSPRRDRAAVRAELGTGDEPVVVQTSRLEPWKGQQLLIEALGRLRDIPWRLWLAGGQSRTAETSFRRKLEQLSSSAGIEARVTFLGERDDISDILGAADVFCQPNIEREPYGITVVEALSAGLPVVATELGATADEIGMDIGRRVRSDADALAEALRELLSDSGKRIQLGSSARRHFFERFSPSSALRDLHDALAGSIPSASVSGRWA